MKINVFICLYRMSPTEFSNYIKQRQMQQHNHYHHQPHQAMYGAIGSVSPARSISPNPMTLQMTPNDSMHQQQNPFVFQNGFGLNMYQSFGSPRFDGVNSYNQFNNSNNGANANDPLLYPTSKTYLDQQPNYSKITNQQQQQNSQPSMQTSQQATTTTSINTNNVNSGTANNNNVSSNANNTNNQQQQDKLLDGMNSFYNNNSNPSYQHLLVAN